MVDFKDNNNFLNYPFGMFQTDVPDPSGMMTVADVRHPSGMMSVEAAQNPSGVQTPLTASVFDNGQVGGVLPQTAATGINAAVGINAAGAGTNSVGAGTNTVSAGTPSALTQATAAAQYNALRPERTFFDTVSGVIADRPVHTFTGTDGDALTRQKEAAMARYPNVPQWIFDVAEQKARAGETAGFWDILKAALSGAGHGAAQAGIKGVAYTAQGVNDSLFNPVGLAQRTINWSQGNGFQTMTPRVEADTLAERALASAAGYVADGLSVSGVLKTVGMAQPLARLATSPHAFVRGPARVVKSLTTPMDPSYEITALMGAAGLTEAVEPETPWGSLATSMIGGMMAPVALGTVNARKELLEWGADKILNFKDARQIANQYDVLAKNPLLGQADDVVADILIRNEEPVTFRRGAALIEPDGKVVTSGKELFRETGTKRNYGFNKALHKHDMGKQEMKRIPEILRGYDPAETTPSGKKIYAVKGKNAPLVVVTSDTAKGRTVASMYQDTRNPDRLLSPKKALLRSRQTAEQACSTGYRTGDSSFVPAGGEAVKSITPLTPSVKGAEEVFPLGAGMAVGGSAAGIRELFEHDIDPSGAERLASEGLDASEVFARHQAYDQSLAEVTARRLLNAAPGDYPSETERLKTLKNSLASKLPRLKEEVRLLGHRFYSDPPSVQSRLLEQLWRSGEGDNAFPRSEETAERHSPLAQGYADHDYLGMARFVEEATTSPVDTDAASVLYKQGHKEQAYGIHGGPYYYDDMADYWDVITAK